MSDDDRRRWDERHASAGGDATGADADELGAPPALAPYEHLVPTRGIALDLACGRGDGSVWLARRGLDVVGVDVSPVAISLAEELAARAQVADRCRFLVHDLDEGLPSGPPVDVVLCHRFRDSRLDDAIVDRLRPGGVLLAVALSEVGADPGRFRALPGELVEAYATLDVVAHHEGAGTAILVARR